METYENTMTSTVLAIPGAKKRPSHWEHPLRRFHYALRQGGQGGFLASEIWWKNPNQQKMVGMMRCNGM